MPRTPALLTLTGRLCLLLAPMAMMPLSACGNAAPEKPTVVGAAFDVVLTDAKGHKIRDKLIFEDKRLNSVYLDRSGLPKVDFKEAPADVIEKPIPWTATFTDERKNSIAFSGTAVKNDITGTLTITASGGTPQTFTFVGGKPGSPGSRKALEAVKL